MQRSAMLANLRKNPEVEVLIIGAGINGIGTFRDLALQGVRVLLVDRGDFCSGASAASSRMVHGGIRYLENGEFRLVREAVNERNRLLRNAPHLVKPLPTTFPIFKTFSGLLNAPLNFLNLLDRPSERGAIVIKLGMSIYDSYTGADQTVPRHQFLNRQTSLNRFPDLNPAIRYTATYFDGAMPIPERIAIELIGDALASHPEAMAINYLAAHSAGGDQVGLVDEIDATSFSVRPQIVINAGGPWIDAVNSALGEPSALIGGTKGSHLVLNHPALRQAIGEHEFFFENQDGRIVLIFPLFDHVLIGTSDLRMEDPDQALCNEEEIDYFFGMIGRVFPRIAVDRSQIVFSYSGVRPLPASKDQRTGRISRDHQIELREPDLRLPYPVFSLVGGKWTSFRAFAEQATDQVLARLGRTRRATTGELPIGGGRDFPAHAAEGDDFLSQLCTSSGLSIQRGRQLFERYGTRSTQLAEFLARSADQPLEHHPHYSRAELRFLIDEEGVERLDDLLLRRTPIAALGQCSLSLLREIGVILGEARDWSPVETEAEVERCARLLRERHHVKI